MSQHKEEALKAIKHVRFEIAAGRVSAGLEQRLIGATLDHAVEQIEAIVEVKRVRKPKPIEVEVDWEVKP